MEGVNWEIGVETYVLVILKSLQIVIAAMKLKDAYFLEGKL